MKSLAASGRNLRFLGLSLALLLSLSAQASAAPQLPPGLLLQDQKAWIRGMAPTTLKAQILKEANDLEALSKTPWLNIASEVRSELAEQAAILRERAADPALQDELLSVVEGPLSHLSAGPDGQAPAWLEVSRPEMIAAGAVGAAALGVELGVKKRKSGQWKKSFGWEEEIRDAVYLQKESARSVIERTGDGLLALLVATPLAEAGWMAIKDPARRDVALELALIDFESYAVTALLTFSLKRALGRERPYVRDCEKGICDQDAYEGFPSAHAAFAFTAAGLICTQHERSGPCLAAMAAATATGLSRIMTDKHYTTDVVAGAAIGLLSGMALPKLMHFSRAKEEAKRDPRTSAISHWGLAPLGLPGGGGLEYQLVFY